MALKFNFNRSNHKLTLNEILEALVSCDMIEESQAQFIAKKKRISQKHPLISIAECEINDKREEGKRLTIEVLCKWLAEYSELDYYHIDPMKVDIGAVTSLLPKAFVKRLSIVPVEINEDEVIYATAEPFFIDWLMDVERTTRKKVKRVVASPKIIENCIEEFYTVHKAVKAISRKNADIDSARQKDIEKMMGNGGIANAKKDEEGISGIVDWLFQYAWDERATDIHLEPKQGNGIVRFRVDGMLRIVYRLEPEIMLSVISRVKIISDMKVDEKRRPQDGRIKRQLEDDKIIEIRTSSIPTHYGEKIVMRIFDPKMADKEMSDLGFTEKDLALWDDLSTRPFGIMLVTGPTGSGKSTTLHSTLKKLATPEVNICTVEDPVEIINEEFNQMQVNHEIDLTFATAIKNFLRQDPDIIMVGEIRDEETGEMAVQASLTGHMVFSTLHTNCALSSINRLVNLGIPPHLLNASLRGMLAQRLVRVLCPDCKKKIKTPEHMWTSMCAPYKVKMPDEIYEPVGCESCKNTGFVGRHVVYELIPMTDKLRAAIHEKVTLVELKKAAEGTYLPIRLHGAKKVIDGTTSIEEILRVVV